MKCAQGVVFVMKDEIIPLNPVDAHVGSRIRVRRELVQMSEDWLAGHLGISAAQLQEIEEGRARIGNRELLLCAEALDVPERYFYMGFGQGGNAPGSKRPPRREMDSWFSANLFPHEGLFLSVGRRMTGSTETAREILHDIYADFVTADKWRAITHPKSYALRAIRNVAASLFQRSKIVSIELVANMETFDQADLGPDAHEILSAKERRRIVLEAIEGLPPQCRKVMKMRRLKEMSPPAIAKELGISVSMVEKHLAKGMAIVAARLADQEPPPLKSGQARRDTAASE